MRKETEWGLLYIVIERSCVQVNPDHLRKETGLPWTRRFFQQNTFSGPIPASLGYSTSLQFMCVWLFFQIPTRDMHITTGTCSLNNSHFTTSYRNPQVFPKKYFQRYNSCQPGDVKFSYRFVRVISFSNINQADPDYLRDNTSIPITKLQPFLWHHTVTPRYLHNNHFSGTIPASLGMSTSLQALWVWLVFQIPTREMQI